MIVYILEHFDEQDIRDIIMMYIKLYEETGNIAFAQNADTLLTKLKDII